MCRDKNMVCRPLLTQKIWKVQRLYFLNGSGYPHENPPEILSLFEKVY